MKIKSIKEIKYEGYVYDLSIRNNHNFVANNILIHNCDRGIFYKKKRYILNVWDSEGVKYYGINDKGEERHPELKIMGIELVKSSTPKIVRDGLRGSINSIMYGTQKDIQKYNKNIKTDFLNRSIEEISFPRSVNDIGKWMCSTHLYKSGTPQHVRAAILFNHMIDKLKLENKYMKIRNGDKIKFVYLKTPNPLREDIIGFPSELPEEFNLHPWVDYNLQFEKAFESSLESMIEPMGWKLVARPQFDI